MGRFGIVVLAALIAPPPVVLQAQETHPFSVHDMLAMERLSDPQVAPDGSVVAFTVRSTDGRRSHVFVLELDNGRSVAGQPVDLMRGLDQDAPPKPFGGAEELAFGPGGDTVIFASRAGGTPEAWSTNFDLYLAPADGSSPPVNLTADNPAWDSHPALSPDGATLAWVAMERPGYESDRFRIRLARLTGSRLEGERDLAADWDRSVSGLAFSADGDTLFATAADLGQRSLSPRSTGIRSSTVTGFARWGPRMAATW